MNLAAMGVLETVLELERVRITKLLLERLQTFRPRIETRSSGITMDNGVRVAAQALIDAEPGPHAMEAYADLERALKVTPYYHTYTEVNWPVTVDAFVEAIKQDFLQA